MEFITITVVKSYSCMIHGARLPSPQQDREMDCYPGSGLVLAQ